MSWATVKLGEISRLHYGKSLSGYSAEKSDEHSVRVFGTNGPIGWTKTALTEQPTLVIGRKGAYRGVKFWQDASWTIDTAFYTTVNESFVVLKWFYYRLLQLDINRMNSGGAIPSTSRDDFYSAEIQVPALQVQERIADILSAYDDLIENNQRRIALLEQAARMLYREWFIHLRFPGHEHAKITNGLPEGWERKTLGDLLTLKRGYDLPAARRVDGAVPIVSSSGVTGYHNSKKADAPGIVTGRYGTIGEVFLINEDFWPLNTALYVSDKKGNPEIFLLHVLRHAMASVQSDKAAVPGVNRNILHTIKVDAPPMRLRQQFEESAAVNFQQMRVLRETNQKLAQARDLLLPRMMNGEIAV